MVKIYQSTDALKARLSKIDSCNVNKRIGRFTSAYVSLGKCHDPTLPIVPLADLEAWLQGITKKPLSPPLSTSSGSGSGSTSGSSSNSSSGSVSSPAPLPIKPPPKAKPPPRVEARLEKPTEAETTPARLLKKVTKKRDRDSLKSIWKGKVDQLVIKESIDDEFLNYDEDDDSEEDTEISKNLKKIKSSAPLPPKPQPQPSHRPQPRNRPQPSNRPPSPPPSPPVSQFPPKAPTPEKEPNWSETLEKLGKNEPHIVYKDLCFFKNRIESDELAKTLPTKLVMKCLQDDEPIMLLDVLNLIFELDYKNDGQFWSELVHRLKRKLDHNMMNYKSKMNVDQVRQLYSKAVIEVNGYAVTSNILFDKLRYNDFMFLTNSATQIKSNFKLEVKKELKPETTSPPENANKVPEREATPVGTASSNSTCTTEREITFEGGFASGKLPTYKIKKSRDLNRTPQIHWRELCT